jgi:hypothetical protein
MIKKLLFISTLFISSAFAEGGFYTGAGLGYADISNTAQGPLNFGSTTSNKTANGNGLASTVYFGYDFNHFVGIQEEYDIAYNSSIADSYSANQQIFGTSLLLHLPFAVFSNELSGISVFAKGGLGYEVAQFSGNSGCSGCVNPSNQNAAFVPIYGLGAEYGFTNVGYRLEWDGAGSIMNTNQGINQTDISSNMVLMSIMYHF